MKNTKGMRLTTVWKLCVEMWDWIAERIRAGDERSVGKLKRAWAESHGWGSNCCFFCLAAPGGCTDCPGKKVTPRFHCMNTAYDYLCEPLKFHAKLHRMYKKFLKERAA